MRRRRDLRPLEPVRRERGFPVGGDEDDRRLLDVERPGDGRRDVPRERREPVGGPAAHLAYELGEDLPVEVALPVEDHGQDPLEGAREGLEEEDEEEDEADLEHAVMEPEPLVEEARDARDPPDVGEHGRDDEDEVEDRAPDDELHVVVAVDVVAEHEAREGRGEDDQDLHEDAGALDRLRAELVDREEDEGGPDEDPGHGPVEAALARVPGAAREEAREERGEDERAREPDGEGRDQERAELREALDARMVVDAPEDLGEDEDGRVDQGRARSPREEGGARRGVRAGPGRLPVVLLEALDDEVEERVEEGARDEEEPGVGDGVAAEEDPDRFLVLQEQVEEREGEPARVPEADRRDEDREQPLSPDPALAAQDHAEEEEVEHGPEEPARDEDDLL